MVKKSNTEAKKLNLPWIEKYRPNSIEQVSSQEEIVAVLKKALTSDNLPHMLFYGPPGTGKTSTILALAKELYGPELIKSRVLELNASDERGISVVREKIKNFAKTNVTIANKETKNSYPCPPYKIIILDEADSMTGDAQSALRRVMENYSKITRFCLICNYISRIIEPLTSRCAKFRFKPLPIDSMKGRLKFICEKENLDCRDNVIESLIKVSDGDLRKGVMFLQSASQLYKDEEIPMSAVNEISGSIPNDVVSQFLNCCLKKKFSEFKKILDKIQNEGYSGTQFLIQFQELLMENEEISSLEKSKLSIKVAQVDKSLVDGSDEYLQLMSLIAV
ncbi:hypothetical protein HK099_000715 [Clydaea vesicula]|uniref:Replication factor C subunit 2 n=1 Tax=Clydaea vesicula TaxID=447962 RepID=A0AAD5U476_9FUNG|nr:hypothetical protein HK099_000715 [Clydaea vesicula]